MDASVQAYVFFPVLLLWCCFVIRVCFQITNKSQWWNTRDWLLLLCEVHFSRIFQIAFRSMYLLFYHSFKIRKWHQCRFPREYTQIEKLSRFVTHCLWRTFIDYFINWCKWEPFNLNLFSVAMKKNGKNGDAGEAINTFIAFTHRDTDTFNAVNERRRKTTQWWKWREEIKSQNEHDHKLTFKGSRKALKPTATTTSKKCIMCIQIDNVVSSHSLRTNGICH